MNRRRPRAAAVFELDRTLLRGTSAPVFAAHLRAAGMSPPPVPPTDSYVKSPLTVAGARLAARASAGWPVAIVAEAAAEAAAELMARVQPYAPGILDDHRAAGHRLVLATVSPEPLVAPLADALGFDDVVATRWRHDGDTYSGAFDGPVVWARAKLGAVRALAERSGLDLAGSWAYSDSYFDAPLLDAVGHPVAVSADPALVALARLEGWPLRHFDLPEGVLKIAGRELQAWTRPLQRPELLPNVRLDVAGVEKVPTTGPVIVVFNHRSYFDASVVGAVVGLTGRPFRFLGKKEVFDAPVLGFLSKMAGGIRVNRASGSDEPLTNAIRALQAGEAVALAPQGTIPRGPAFFDPELKGRWGAARLAQATRAPVIPMGLWGTEKVWPRNSRLPRLDPTERPEVRVRVGDPVELKYRSLDADTRRIMAALVDQLPPEAHVVRTPTEQELAATFPPGYRGDPTRETQRRPGTDTGVAGDGDDEEV